MIYLTGISSTNHCSTMLNVKVNSKCGLNFTETLTNAGNASRLWGLLGAT